MKSEIERRVDDVKNRREDIRDQLKTRIAPPSRSSTAARSSPASTSSRLPDTKSTTSSEVKEGGKGKNSATGSGTICVKVHCKNRAEIYFKMTKQTKFERLFKAWSARMDTSPLPSSTSMASGEGGDDLGPQSKSETENKGETAAPSPPDFIYTHNGRPISEDMTVDDVGVEDGDAVVAVELVDLTESVVSVIVGNASSSPSLNAAFQL
jgi:hypothetical protein